MKHKLTVLFSVIASSFLQAQGTFQNLDFEQASIVLLNPSQEFYSASDALPDWTAYLGNTPVNWVLYDDVTIGSPAVSIQDSLSPVVQQPLQGAYSVVLQHSGIDSTTAGIGQTGLLPQDAASILFYVANYQTLQLTFAGTNSIPLTYVGATGNYSIYGGNIAPYAGQTGELLFTDIANNSQPMMLDYIHFSTSSIPEPGILGLFVLCGLFFGLRRWRHFAR